MAPKPLKKNNKILILECKDTALVPTQSGRDGPAGSCTVIPGQIKRGVGYVYGVGLMYPFHYVTAWERMWWDLRLKQMLNIGATPELLSSPNKKNLLSPLWWEPELTGGFQPHLRRAVGKRLTLNVCLNPAN